MPFHLVLLYRPVVHVYFVDVFSPISIMCTDTISVESNSQSFILGDHVSKCFKQLSSFLAITFKYSAVSSGATYTDIPCL